MKRIKDTQVFVKIGISIRKNHLSTEQLFIERP